MNDCYSQTRTETPRLSVAAIDFLNLRTAAVNKLFSWDVRPRVSVAGEGRRTGDNICRKRLSLDVVVNPFRTLR